jgi:hypothetical protein
MSYDIVIRVIGQDDASKPLSNVNSALGNIAQFAAGGLLVGGHSGDWRCNFGSCTVGAVGRRLPVMRTSRHDSRIAGRA